MTEEQRTHQRRSECHEIHSDHSKKLDNIYMERFPCLEKKREEGDARCHAEREKGDKELERNKLNAKVFYVLLSAFLLIVGFGIKYTYSTGQEHTKLADKQKVQAIEQKVDMIREQQIQVVTTLSVMTETLKEIKDNQREIKKAVDNK